MDFLHTFLDFFLHIDKHLEMIIFMYGRETYVLLFGIIFSETGFVVTPFLPGDSLLFAAAAFAAKGSLNIWILFALLTVAAVAGNIVNYLIGRRIGSAVFGWKSRWINPEHLRKTQAFFAQHGAVTIVITRFMPIFRTFAPFVAGVGAMPFKRFLAYNLLGGVLWTTLLLGAGYFFGTIPFVEKHFSAVILAIIVISLLPGVIGWLRTRKR